MTAGSGALQSIVFPGASSQVAQNTTVEIDGQTRQLPFTYQVVGGATQKSFAVVRTGGAGTPTTLVGRPAHERPYQAAS